MLIYIRIQKIYCCQFVSLAKTREWLDRFGKSTEGTKGEINIFKAIRSLPGRLVLYDKWKFKILDVYNLCQYCLYE